MAEPAYQKVIFFERVEDPYMDAPGAYAVWEYMAAPHVVADFAGPGLDRLLSPEEAEDMSLALDFSGHAYFTRRIEKDQEDRPHGLYIELDRDDNMLRRGFYVHGLTQGAWYDADKGPYLWCENGQNPDGLRADTELELGDKVRRWKQQPPSLEP